MIKAFWLSFLLLLPSWGADTETLKPEKIEKRALDLKSFLEKEKSQF
jgi:hypothetical protein